MKWFLTVLAVCLTVLCGCTRRERQKFSPLIPERKAEWALAEIVDVSGSYREYSTGSDGRAFRAMNKVKSDFFRNVEDGRLLIAQISGAREALIWNSRVKAYRREFPTGYSLSNFLEAHSNSNGSLVWSSIAQTAEFLADLHEQGKIEASCLVCFSDLDDNDPDGPAQKKRLEASLRRLHTASGGKCIPAFYWVSRPNVDCMVAMLKRAGFQNIAVDYGITADPELPTFADQ